MDRKAPPQLVFDDGSRIMTEAAEQEHEHSETAISPRGTVSIESYYEIERLARETVDILQTTHRQRNEEDAAEESCMYRVALQFPDELLDDSPDVCWAMEDAIVLMMKDVSGDVNDDEQPSRNDAYPLVFILGDTTFGPCCPDEVSAMHLEADVLIHYGHACLSPARSLPVLYGFGVTEMDVSACVDTIVEQARTEGIQKLLLLYEVRYHHAMEQLQAKLKERGDLLVLMGQIPDPSGGDAISDNPRDKNKNACCSGEGQEKSNCCRDDQEKSNCCRDDQAKAFKNAAPPMEIFSGGIGADDDHRPEVSDAFVVGGLELPSNVDLSSYTLLFVGDASQGSTSSRQYVNTMLRFVSYPSTSPSNHWTYSPSTQTLETNLPSTLQRKLHRRFYLTQKARDASVFGILVGTLSQRHFRSVVSSLRTVIESAGRSCYTFAVGKINGAKLANFGEIDCFILIACNENSLLDNERDFHLPVITPLELDMALGNVEWGSTAYSLDYNDFLSMQTPKDSNAKTVSKVKVEGTDDDDDDAPYYSLVTGKYESRRKTSAGMSTDPLNLNALPGQGQIAKYESAAAKYLKKREYKGLIANVGQDKARAAIPGQVGIASDYGNE